MNHNSKNLIDWGLVFHRLGVEVCSQQEPGVKMCSQQEAFQGLKTFRCVSIGGTRSYLVPDS